MTWDHINMSWKRDYNYEHTPLLLAIRNGFESNVKLLLVQDDINVNWKDKDGDMLLPKDIRVRLTWISGKGP